MKQQQVTGSGSQRSHVVVTNENLCKQHDPHLEIEFDLDEKHIHLLSTTQFLMHMFLVKFNLRMRIALFSLRTTTCDAVSAPFGMYTNKI